MKVNDLLLALSISYSIKLQVTRACSFNMKQAPEITKSIQTTKNKSIIVSNFFFISTLLNYNYTGLNIKSVCLTCPSIVWTLKPTWK